MKFAVVLTHNRPGLLRQTVDAISPQVDHVVVIDNASDPPAKIDASDVNVIYVPDQPPNLALLWQAGIDEVQPQGAKYVAFLCDDSPPPFGWYDAVVAAMKATGAVIGASSPFAGSPAQVGVKVAPDHDIMGRMPGWAFVLDIDSPVRPDPAMHWWWLDTDLDWQARAAGGMVMIGGYVVPNNRPNEFTYARPWAAERIGLDRIAFEAKHGVVPW